MTKSKLWLAVVAGMAAAWAGCTKKNPHKCNAEEPCTLVEAPFCDITGAIGGTPYRCVPDPGTDGGTGALTVDRGSHDFGAVPVGQTSPPATLTITNTGAVATGTLATAVGGAQATAFMATADTCAGQALAPAATCTVTLTFMPAGGSAAVGSLTVAGMPGGSVTVALSGSGVAPGAVAMAPPSADFGSVVINMSSANTTFTVSNPGSAPTGMLSTALGGADAAHFAITSDGCAGQVLAGGGSCTLTARFSPTSMGSKNATLSVTPTGSSTTTSTLTGMGLMPGEITMSPPARDFGSLPQGDTTGTPFSFTVTNGGQAATGSLVVSLTGGDASQFSITTNGCMGQTLAATASCMVSVRFNPTSAGTKTASLTVTGTPGGSVTASLNGMGLSPPSLLVSPGTQNFGDVITGNSSTQVFTLTNAGGVASGVPSASLGGADMAMFSVSSNTCTTGLAPAASCMIGVRFQPSSTGAKVGTLNISATPGGSALAMLSGNGIPPSALTFTPANLDLGSQLQNTSGTAMRLTVTNTGGAASGAVTVALAGTAAGEFAITAQTCNGMTLAAAATCTVDISFRPTSRGSKNASLNLTATPGGPAAASLMGNGLAPALLTVAPTSNSYGNVPTGSSSSAATFTITNTGDVNSGVPAVSLGGTHMNQFSTSDNGCSSALAPGLSCTVRASFVPTALGAKTANLNIMATPGGAPAAALDGNGVAPGLLAFSPTSYTFPSTLVTTQSATQMFTLSNGGGAATGTIMTSITGTQANQFTIVTDGCNGMTLPAAGSCNIVARFAPSSSGAKSASLSATASPGGTINSSLDGMGLSPASLSVSPGTQNFGDVITGNGSTQVFTLTNTGGVASGVPSPSIGGADMAMFSISSNTCTTTVAPAGSCMIGVRFQPASAGAKLGTLNISATPGGSTLAMLSGNGIPPSALTFTPANLDLGSQLVSTNGTPMRLTVTNTGGASSGTVTVALGGTASGEFAIAAQTCNGMTLSAAASCTVDISFRPTSRGSKNASLNLTATPGGPAAASLMGNGLSPALLVVSPTSNSYGNVPTGSSSSAATFTVTNTGDVNSGVPTVALGGTHMTQFSTSNNNCTTALAPGGMCTVRASFVPTALGAKTASLNITASPGGSPAAGLDGNGVAPGLLTFSPTTYTFASTVVGVQSVTHMFTLSNGGGAPTGTITTSITGTQANQFTIVTDGCSGMTLAAAGSCNILARFDPTASGAKSASLSATASPGGTINSTLNGTGLAQAVLSLSPPSQGFGSVPIGSSSAPIIFTVSNSGEVVSGTPVVSKTGTDAAAFVVSNNNCTTGIAAGSTCTFQITFNSTGTAGSRSAGVTVTASPGGAPSSTLSAMAVAPGLLVMSPTSSDFATALVGAQGVTRTFTLSNNGGAPTTAVSLSITPAGQFVIESGMDGCSGQILAPMGMSGSSCTVTLRFTPSSRGLTGATFAATASTGGTASSSISGTGQTPATLVVSPLSFGFGSVVLNTTSEAATFTITNTGDVPSGVPSITVMGTDFMLSANRCTTAIAPSTLCEVEVTFRPTSAVLRTGSLNVSASPGGTPPVVTLNGTGVTPGNLVVSPTGRDFGQASQNSQGMLQVFTVTNMGGSATTAITATIDGSQSGHFTIASNACHQVILQANGNCQVSVRFIPQSPGSKTASLTVSATTGGTAIASLSGVGTAAIVAMLFGTGAGVTTSSPSGISCPGTCSAEFPGGSVVLTTLTDTVSYLTNLVGCTSRIGSVCTILVDQPKNMGAYFAPSWTVSHNGPASGDDSAYAVAVDPQGFVLAAGAESVDQGGTAYKNFWLGKYSSDGVEQWTRSTPCTQSAVSCAVYGVAVDSSGAAVIVGTDYVPNFVAHAWVRKYSAAGAILWTRSQPEDAVLNGVDIDLAGNVYIVGRLLVSGEGDNIWLRKLDVDGNTVWTRSYNGSASGHDNGVAVKADLQGNVVVAGTQRTAGAEQYPFDIFVRKYDAAGGIVWTSVYSYPGDSWDSVYAIDIDAQSDVVVAGAVGGVLFNPGFMWGRKLSSSTGATLWTYVHPDNYTLAAAVAIDRSGNVNLVGRTEAGTVMTNLVVKLNAGGSNPRIRSGATVGTNYFLTGAATDDFDNLVYVGVENTAAAQNAYIRKVGP